MRNLRIGIAALTLAVGTALGASGCGDNDKPATCGNARLDPFGDPPEECDSAIPAGEPGACPRTVEACNDENPCTVDTVAGDPEACSATCEYVQVVADLTVEDACCPAGATASTDLDCGQPCGNGVLDAGEECDIAIEPGTAGACPTTCSDGVACTQDILAGVGCLAACSNPTITDEIDDDGCCPTGATSGTDNDCSAACDNGVLDPGETCDTAITTGLGKCPTLAECDDDDVCTTDSLLGGACAAQCQHVVIIDPIDDDQCCPPAANANNDNDCTAQCGNGAVETGEFCDTAIPGSLAGACPAACNDMNACTTDAVTGLNCQARCTVTAVGPNLTTPDTCCPPIVGNATNDIDCMAVCGNGVLETAAGEACDTAIASGVGKCPALADCNDANACTTDGTAGVGCAKACTHAAVTACSMTGDGCCPMGCTGLNDADCSLTCGNGTVEASETCDTDLVAPDPGACPTGPADCSDGVACTADSVQSPGTCNAECIHSPITTEVTGDGCCPDGANQTTDNDCPSVCGNDVVEAGETCDTGLASGVAGACPTACDDSSDCTDDALTNGGTCLAACVYTDRADEACCGDGVVETTDATTGNPVSNPELCDTNIPVGSSGACPSACDDLDACTTDALVAGGTCNAECTITPFTPCCGDDVITPFDAFGNLAETCEPSLNGGPGGCDQITCVDSYLCTTDESAELGGNQCAKVCTHTPVNDAMTPDSCCAPGSRFGTDADCVCGNMTVEAPEACDDGNTTNDDMCTNSCTIAENIVGAPCGADEECAMLGTTVTPVGGSESTCIETDDLPGLTNGFVGGYCTMTNCNPGDPYDSCPQIDPMGVANAICVQPPGAPFGLCAALCTLANGDSDCRRNETNLLGAYAYRCTPISPTQGICQPRSPTY